MKIAKGTVPGGLVIRLEGPLDTNSAPELAGPPTDVESVSGRLVFDLADLSYVSSAGLRILLMAARAMESAGGSAALCSVQDPVKEILEIAGFTEILPIFPDREAAFAG